MNNAIQITMDTSEYPIRSVGEISILPKAIPIFTDSRPRKKYRRRNLVARTNEASQKHSADAFVDKNDIDDIIYSLLIGSSTKNKRMFTKAAAFTAGINTGYRAGDVLSLRVEDVVDEKGNIIDELYLSEDKTDKTRVVYLNKAVKTAIRFIIDVNQLSPENYLFTGEGNRTAYIDRFEYDEDGEIINVVTTGEKERPDGTIREITPLWVSSLSRIIIDKAKKLGISGHYSSHCMRNTFAEFISRDFEDNRNPLAASKALNHADVKTTIEYYMKVNPQRLKHQWQNLNLGLEVWEMFIEDFYGKC